MADGDDIEAYCNNHRKHSALAYRTPVQFERHISGQNGTTHWSRNQLHLTTLPVGCYCIL